MLFKDEILDTFIPINRHYDYNFSNNRYYEEIEKLYTCHSHYKMENKILSLTLNNHIIKNKEWQKRNTFLYVAKIWLHLHTDCKWINLKRMRRKEYRRQAKF